MDPSCRPARKFVLQVEAEITQLQALIVDLAVSKSSVATAANEAASAAAGLAQPAPEPETSSSSDDVSEVHASHICSQKSCRCTGCCAT